MTEVLLRYRELARIAESFNNRHSYAKLIR